MYKQIYTLRKVELIYSYIFYDLLTKNKLISKPQTSLIAPSNIPTKDSLILTMRILLCCQVAIWG